MSAASIQPVYLSAVGRNEPASESALPKETKYTSFFNISSILVSRISTGMQFSLQPFIIAVCWTAACSRRLLVYQHFLVERL